MRHLPDIASCDVTDQLNSAWFARHLRRALTSPYDPSGLRASPLVQLLGEDGQDDPVCSLRHHCLNHLETSHASVERDAQTGLPTVRAGTGPAAGPDAPYVYFPWSRVSDLRQCSPTSLEDKFVGPVNEVLDERPEAMPTIQAFFSTDLFRRRARFIPAHFFLSSSVIGS